MKWTHERYTQLTQDLRSDAISTFGEITIDMAYEMAKNTLRFEHGLREFMIQELGVTPRAVAERLAEDI